MGCTITSCGRKFESYEMMVAHIVDSHGTAAYDAHINSLMEISSSKRKFAIFGNKGVDKQSSQDTRNTQTTANEKSALDLHIEDASQNKINSHVIGNEEIMKQPTNDVDSTIMSSNVKHLEYAPLSLGNEAIDLACYNFNDHNQSLESDINLDLELICNFFGNGRQTATRIFKL